MSVCADLRARTEAPGAYVAENFPELPPLVASQGLSRLARQGWLEHRGRVYLRPPVDDEEIVVAVLRKLGERRMIAARDAALDWLQVPATDGRRAAVLVGVKPHRFDASLPRGWTLVVRDESRNEITPQANIILEALRWRRQWPAGREAQIRRRIRGWLNLMSPDDLVPALQAEPRPVLRQLRELFEQVGWPASLAEARPSRVTLRG